MTAARPSPLPLPAIWRASALLLLGHGSSKLEGAAAPLRRLRDILQNRGLFAEVGLGFLAGEPALKAALARTGAERAYLVPCFISAGYFSQVRIPAALGLSGALTYRLVADRRQALCYCEPLGEHPGLAGLAEGLALRQAAAEGIRSDQATLLLVAHGNAADPASADNAYRHVAHIAGRGRFAAVAAAFLEQAPLLAGSLGGLQGDVVVVGLFTGEGRHGSGDLAAAVAAEQVRRTGDAGRVINAGIVGTEAGMADLVLEQVRAFDRRDGN